MIGIIDYGIGNLGSILNMFRKIRAEAVIASEPAVIEKARGLVLPGVGAFDRGMGNLEKRRFIPLLEERVCREKVPILGLCLGMQLFTKKSEEGELPGLGWIEAETIRFDSRNGGVKLRVPHMGWNTIRIIQGHAIFRDMPEESRFYFVHSYYARCGDNSNILATTNHGHEFVSAFYKENIIGVQFHPEKSHKFGMKLMKNFAEICGA